MVPSMRSLISLAAALLASLTLAACSGGDAVALDPVANAATRTQSAGSSRMLMEMSVGVGAQKFFVNAEGAMDYKHRRGWLLMDLSQLAALNPRGPELPRLNMLFENTTVWMRVPPALTAATGGKPWARMSLASSAQTFGGIQQPDPSQMLDSLRGISGSVKKVGKTSVRGVETTHYTADVSLEKALAQAPAGQREAAKAALKLFGGMNKMPVDLYIDGAGRVRRMEMEYKLQSGGTPFETEVKLELFDFGTRVAFKRPPASQTAALNSLVD
jgi:hypothetical protein